MQIALRSAGGVASFDDLGEGEGDVFFVVRRLVDEERVERRRARLPPPAAARVGGRRRHHVGEAEVGAVDEYGNARKITKPETESAARARRLQELRHRKQVKAEEKAAALLREQEQLHAPVRRKRSKAKGTGKATALLNHN